jgi:regulator of replication initiation timing
MTKKQIEKIKKYQYQVENYKIATKYFIDENHKLRTENNILLGLYHKLLKLQ